MVHCVYIYIYTETRCWHLRSTPHYHPRVIVAGIMCNSLRRAMWTTPPWTSLRPCWFLTVYDLISLVALRVSVSLFFFPFKHRRYIAYTHIHSCTQKTLEYIILLYLCHVHVFMFCHFNSVLIGNLIKYV